MLQTEPKTPRILIIDDNPSIHEIFKKILKTDRDFNYRIDCANQGEEGLEFVKKQGDDFYALAFVDVRMPPGWDGVETIEQIWKVDPRIQMVICTAYSNYCWDDTMKIIGENNNLLLLKKPFDTIEVRQIVHSLIKKWQLGEEVVQNEKNLEALVSARSSKINATLAHVRATLESTGDGILVVDSARKVVDYNNRFVEMWNIPINILKSMDDKKFIEYILAQIENSKEFIEKVNKFYLQTDLEGYDEIDLKDGRVFERFSQAHQVGNKIVGRVWNFRDVTDKNKRQEEWVHQATHDSLTSLPNRNLLKDRIQQAIALSNRNKTKFGLAFLDLDKIKVVNDKLGHGVGDLLIIAVANRLTEYLRETDTVARIGGDEFVIVIAAQPSEQDISMVSEKIIELIRKPFYIQGHQLNITGSIGVSIYPNNGKHLKDLLKFADSAMYYAKEAGGNNIKKYDKHMTAEEINRLAIENSLQNAIKNNEFILYYQPTIDLALKEIVSVEALIRWNHPVLGLLSPSDFIPIAEESELIIPLGEWILYEACRQNKAWQDAGLKPLGVSVNLSGKQLKKQKVNELMVRILEETRLDAQFLELEMNEMAIIENPELALRVTKKLKNMGISLTMDDFGIGYSSLNFLRMFPFNTLKVDRTFIKKLDKSEEDRKVVRAIISMAKSLSLKTLAQGIENPEQLNFLEKNKCDEGQGFLFSEAVKPDVIEKLLKENTLFRF